MDGADAVAGDLDALLGRLDADAAALAALPLAGLDGPRAAAARRVLRLVADRVQMASAGLLAAVDADGRWAAGGRDRSLPGWVARQEGIGFAQARREVNLGQAMVELPSARAAVVSGQITRGHADVLAEVGMSSPARRAALTGPQDDRNEAALVAQARRLGVDEFRKAARRWAIAVDGAAAEREHTHAVARESLVLSRRRDGVAFTGFLTHENGELLTTAIRAVAGVPAADDDRSLEQRQAAALTGIARLVLDKGLTGRGAQLRPHLNVHVSYETLERLSTDSAEREHADCAHHDAHREHQPGAGVRAHGGDGAVLPDPAELDGGEPVPASVLARIACDSEVTRIVFGPAGQVLDVGRAERTYSDELRRAIIARDRHCQYPDCTAPPTLGEVHHIRWWSRLGPTSTDNGILLCWHHHAHVHTHDLTIHRRPHGFTFRHPDGRPITSTRAA